MVLVGADNALYGALKSAEGIPEDITVAQDSFDELEPGPKHRLLVAYLRLAALVL